MRRSCLAAALLGGACLSAGELPREVLSIDYTRDGGLVAAAYRGGQVVVWDFESGRVLRTFNPSPPRATLSRPLARFNSSGRLLALTQEGDAGLAAYDVAGGKSTTLVPRRLLVRGITAVSWSRQNDTVLTAVGRDIYRIDAAGRTQWQRRLETRALITDVEWHPTGEFYTVATDNGEVSTWETSSGRVLGSGRLETGAHAAALKAVWTSENTLAACVRGVSLTLLDPESLAAKKVVPSNCLDLAWSAGGKEIFVWSPPSIAVFGESGQRARELRTPFEGEGPIVWAGEGRLLTGFSDATVVLRDARGGKVLRTFAP